MPDLRWRHLFPQEKIASLSNIPPPTDMAEARHIIGLALYYRKFIANFSDILRPLTDMTKKNTPFIWNPLYQVSFDAIKISLMNSPILIFPDPNQNYVLYTDASKHSWQEVLIQDKGV